MGALIIQEVVRELLGKGLSGAKVLLGSLSSPAASSPTAPVMSGVGLHPSPTRWLFDEAQLTVDNVHLTGQPVQEGQWLYIQNVGRELRQTLKDVAHWTEVQVKGTSLPRALHCWDRSLHEGHKGSKAPLKGCPVHLVDSCSWPHCNPSCPTIRDQFTGQEMNVAQFLMHMGFDVQALAQQQGLEPSTFTAPLHPGRCLPLPHPQWGARALDPQPPALSPASPALLYYFIK
ncbi:Protein notum like protein [Myotis brandtii]|uniref:Protein notum like protein n=1 Tax=Myotis brandtii TaxID=109478 RepID=S7NPB5_MYOBR|nr:Protein notum like protein [Myotis brandtii]